METDNEYVPAISDGDRKCIVDFLYNCYEPSVETGVYEPLAKSNLHAEEVLNFLGIHRYGDELLDNSEVTKLVNIVDRDQSFFIPKDGYLTCTCCRHRIEPIEDMDAERNPTDFKFCPYCGSRKVLEWCGAAVGYYKVDDGR